ncbi:CD109 antigen-like [Anopheles aquasalis]|uniref:CD109 antigen-like n=1 Tax=Anopheles aquasalis TaxID=42839 RepID=UPI00215A4486|nr:CD109 antigen-like [Anopheles aquasalis]
MRTFESWVIKMSFRTVIFSFLMLVGFSQAVLIVGPKTFRANRDYKMVIHNFYKGANKVDLLMCLEGRDEEGNILLNITKSTDVRKNTNKLVSFKMPEHVTPGYYKLTIDGQNGFAFKSEAELIYLNKTIAALIQFSKPAYKPGDSVEFRVIVLDPNLKPPSEDTMVNVTVKDSIGNIISKWSDAPLSNGVLEGEMDLATSPLPGIYSIEVESNDEQLASKTFEVKEYVLSTFDVNVYPTTVPLEEHKMLNLTIEANYYFGKPVIGTVKMQLVEENVVLESNASIGPSIREWDVNGLLQVSIPYVTVLNNVDERNINLNITFTEQYTNRTVTKEHQITVYKHKYKVTLEEKNHEFHRNAPYKATLLIANQNGTPAAGVAVQVQVDGLDNAMVLNSTSDKKGFIGLYFEPPASADAVNITVTIGEERLLFETIKKVEHSVNGNIEIELKSPAQLNKMLKAVVKCSTRGSFFAYFVIAKGNIVDSGSYSLGQVTRHSIQFNVTEPMVPKFKLVVATVSNNIIVYDYVDVVVKEFLNNFDIRIVGDKSDTFRPDNQIEFNLLGRPEAYVALASYDKSVLQHGSLHDIGLDDVWRVFEGFHTPESNKFDVFQSMGLFVRVLDELPLERAPLRSSRKTVPLGGTAEPQRLVAYRTDFPEAWLWKTLALPSTGRITIVEQLPDTTTSWYLTGFSIDPVYGFGIIKKPLQFTTDQPFYIVDNLPYSVKRGEAVLLQFTLFNTLGAEYMADVTMYNVANQIEFVGAKTKGNILKKTLTVPPNVGVPVAFLVKPKKLGDMVVRLEASIMMGAEKDGVERLVRVLPAALVHTRMISNLVAHKTYTSELIDIPLDFGSEPEVDSIVIDFSVTPSVLTNVIENLGKLLAVPTGCGEQNMIRFVPNVVVLDYMHATSSTEYAIMEKARRYLQTGYQNQMRYRKQDGSFGVWKHGVGSIFLTAFVGKSMKTAAKYIYVDQYQMGMAYAWLASKQKTNGRFDEVGPVFHTDMQGGLRHGLALTSYVMIAFLENAQQAARHRTVVERGMRYIASNIHATSDVYDLAIATYALWLNKHSEKSRAINRLAELSTEQRNGQQRFWFRQSNQIETTAYALLAFVEADRYTEGVAIMRWLVNQRYATGSFPRTQDTFVALKALTKLAEKIFPKANDYLIQLEHAQERKEFTVNSANISFASAERIPNTVKDLKVTFTGTGTALVQVAYQYSTNLLQSSNRFKLEVTRKHTTSSFVLKLLICSSFEPALSDERSNMALVEVNLPSGYVVDGKSISEATTENPIREKEILYGATSIVLYYDNMGNERNCFVVTAYRRFKVALRRPAYVKVHDYYNPSFYAIKAYEVDRQELCDLCDSSECSSTCHRGS